MVTSGPNFLCTLCLSIVTETVKSVIKRRHHESRDALERSASAGCGLCTRVNARILRNDLNCSPSSDLNLWSNVTDDGLNRFMSFECPELELHFLSFLTPINPGELHMGDFDDSPLESYTGSPKTMLRIKGWLDHCCSTHGKCSSVPSSTVPTRLVDVGLPNINRKPRLVLGSSLPLDAQYLTLSHCWGQNPQFMTLSVENLSLLMSEIQPAQLSKNFQDAIQITRSLGHRYIWIDSLCIIQDSPGQQDWIKESKLMHQVYKNSFCTIAARDAEDADQGCLFERNALMCQPLGGLAFDIDDSALTKRAWAFQERFMSPRVLHFKRDEVCLECTEGNFRESTANCCWPCEKPGFSVAPETTAGLSQQFPSGSSEGIAQMNRNRLMDQWWRVLGSYSSCLVTRNSDRLIAISAVVQDLGTLLDDQFVCGLWIQDFPRCLLWSTNSSDDHSQSEEAAEYLAPSWSWASLRPGKEVNEIGYSTERSYTMADLIGVTVCTPDNSTFTLPISRKNAWMVLIGRLTPAEWRARKDNRPALWGMHGDQMWLYIITSNADYGYKSFRAKVDDKTVNYAGKDIWVLPLRQVRPSTDFHGLVLVKTEENKISQVYQRIGCFDTGSGFSVDDFSERRLLTLV